MATRGAVLSATLLFVAVSGLAAGRADGLTADAANPQGRKLLDDNHGTITANTAQAGANSVSGGGNVQANQDNNNLVAQAAGNNALADNDVRVRQRNARNGRKLQGDNNSGTITANTAQAGANSVSGGGNVQANQDNNNLVAQAAGNWATADNDVRVRQRNTRNGRKLHGDNNSGKISATTSQAGSNSVSGGGNVQANQDNNNLVAQAAGNNALADNDVRVRQRNARNGRKLQGDNNSGTISATTSQTGSNSVSGGKNVQANQDNNNLVAQAAGNNALADNDVRVRQRNARNGRKLQGDNNSGTISATTSQAGSNSVSGGGNVQANQVNNNLVAQAAGNNALAENDVRVRQRNARNGRKLHGDNNSGTISATTTQTGSNSVSGGKNVQANQDNNNLVAQAAGNWATADNDVRVRQRNARNGK